MDILLTKISTTDALIKLNLKEADYQTKVEEKIKDYCKKAKIKGFRPGKVPRSMVEKMYGKSILVDEINHLVSRKVMEYIREQQLQILGEPLPNLESLAAIDWENAKDFNFEYSIGLASPFEVKVDSKVKIETYSIKIDDKLINETIDNLRDQFGEMTNPESSDEGDAIYGEFLTMDNEDNKHVSLELEKIEKKERKAFFGKKSGDHIEFDPAKLIKDDNYRNQIVPVGSKGKITFVVKNINRIIPAQVDQELFDQTFGKDVVTTEVEFKAKIKESFSENYRRETDRFADIKVREALIENTKIELPDNFLKKWLKATNSSISESQIATEYPMYVGDLKWSLIRNQIAEKNRLKVEHADVINEAKNLIRDQFGGMGMSEQLENSLDAFADNYLKANESENYRKLYDKVFNDRVIDFVKTNITIKSKEVSSEEYREKI